MENVIDILVKRLDGIIAGIGELMTTKQRSQQIINDVTADIVELTARKIELEKAIQILKDNE